jgi:hypothetical protein
MMMPIASGWDIYVACQLVAVVVCLLKGRVVSALLGLPFSVVALVGAVRLARPGSLGALGAGVALFLAASGIWLALWGRRPRPGD